MTETKAPYIPALHNLALAAIRENRFQSDIPGIDGGGRKVRGLKFSKTWAVPKQPIVETVAADPLERNLAGIPTFLDNL